MLIIIILITCFVFALLAKRHIEKIIEKHRIEDGIVDAQETKDVLDEKDSIKQAEAIIKRRKLYSRTLKISVASSSTFFTDNTSVAILITSYNIISYRPPYILYGANCKKCVDHRTFCTVFFRSYI